MMANDDGTLPGCTTPEAHRAMMAYRRCFELHTYYDAVAPHTFETRFIDVPLPAARAWRVVNSGRTPSDAADAAAFDQLRAGVTATIGQMAGAEGIGYFFKQVSGLLKYGFL